MQNKEKSDMMTKDDNQLLFEPFAEIIIEGDEQPTQSKSIPISFSEEEREKVGEIRRKFNVMRSLYNDISFKNSYQERLQAVLFYRQAEFMADFEDDYEGRCPFFMYFPDLNSMSYEQLRTYFTWRTNVRKGKVEKVPYSYAFVYIYELLNNVGVKDGVDGLQKLIIFWNKYRAFEQSLDKYMVEWVRDYYIVNDMPIPLDELVKMNFLLEKSFTQTRETDLYNQYGVLSTYKLEKSNFYTKENEMLIISAFNFVIDKLIAFMKAQGKSFDDLVYFESQLMVWSPFHGANYVSQSMFNHKKRYVCINEKEKYYYNGEYWYFEKPPIVTNSGKTLITYLIKRIEQFYRNVNGYKYKMSVSVDRLPIEQIERIFPLEKFLSLIDSAISENHRASQIKVITVDKEKLSLIRQNAEIIQEKLLVTDESEEPATQTEMVEEAVTQNSVSQIEEIIIKPDEQTISMIKSEESEFLNEWQRFAKTLNVLEHDLLELVIKGKSLIEVTAFIKQNNMMLEVVLDSINEKAYDEIGDNILAFSDSIELFDDYIEDLKECILSE